jgi:PhoPQ-activated pathogenicity-related protein
VDPWRYRQALVQPKLIVLATNDAYWPVDAAGIYLDGLPGTTRLLYLPNNRHSLSDLRRLVTGLRALQRSVTGGPPLPALEWQHSGAAGRARLRFRSDRPPAAWRAWYATSPGRDFRPARWQARPAVADGDGWYRFTTAAPEDYYVGIYGEAEYGAGDDRFYLTTGLRIIGPGGLLPLAATGLSDSPSGPAAPAPPR